VLTPGLRHALTAYGIKKKKQKKQTNKQKTNNNCQKKIWMCTLININLNTIALKMFK